MEARRPWQDRWTLSDRDRARQPLAVLLMAFALPENHERKPNVRYPSALSSTGVGASSTSRPARSPARPTAPSSPLTARPQCWRPSSPPRAARRHRLPAAHRRLPGEVLRRRPHSRRLFQARRPSDRKGDAGLAPDRPPDPSAVRRRLAQRDAGDRHDAVARSGERSRHLGAGRVLGRADAVGRAVHGPDRRRARRLHQQRIHPQSDARGDGREPARSRRRRHAGRRADGRVGGQGASRGDHARRRDVRPPPFPAGDPGDHRARREGRQGAARAQGDRQRRAREGDARPGRDRICAPPMRSPTRWRVTRRSTPPRPR